MQGNFCICKQIFSEEKKHLKVIQIVELFYLRIIRQIKSVNPSISRVAGEKGLREERREGAATWKLLF